MKDFVICNWDWLLTILCAVIGALFVYVRTRSLVKSLNFLKENLFMGKFKTSDTNGVVQQSFSDTIPDYVLNPQTNELEELEVPKNVQVFIQSYIDCALERALERYLPKETDNMEPDPREEYETAVADLAVLGEAMEQAEFYRERFGLSNRASIADIYAEVDKQAQLLKVKIAENNKEVKQDEASSLSVEQTEESS